jgi:histone RNA hairpin-binding protein
MQWEEQVKRFDPNDPVQANRIQQRRKMIQKGKNTAGYDNYIQSVPKEERIPRSMKTPATPDPTVDISVKRWLGQVRAWYVPFM